VKGTVFDVTRNNAYGQGGQYHGEPQNYPSPSDDGRTLLSNAIVFAGKDPSRALATSSLKAEDCVPEWSDLEDKHKTVLDEWYTFFSKRYNIVGKVSSSGAEAKM
jgi:membrane-associated progesterone receptor component